MKIIRDKNDWDGSERRSRERLFQIRMSNPLKIFRISNLRKRLVIYFVLIIFVTMSVGIQLIFETGSGRLLNKISVAAELDSLPEKASARKEVETVLKQFQHRMILVMGIVFICVIATMVVFIRNIVEPLDAIGRSAKRITEGHLDETVPIRCDDEIGQIGELINDLAINLQEVLLHVWNHTCQDIRLMDNIAEIIHSQPGDIMPRDVREQFDFVRSDIEEMQEIVKAFDYYNIRFEGEKLVGEEPVAEFERESAPTAELVNTTDPTPASATQAKTDPAGTPEPTRGGS